MIGNHFTPADCLPEYQLKHQLGMKSGQKLEYKLKDQTEILKALLQTRFNTLNLFENSEAKCIFASQIDPEFSPIGWHLGHIAYTEALWILAKFGGSNLLCRKYETYFANGNAIGYPDLEKNYSLKSERTNLPDLAEILDYVQLVRTEVLSYFDRYYAIAQARTWYWLIQHEIQHCETIAFLLHLNSYLKQQKINDIEPIILQQNNATADLCISSQSVMIDIPASEFWQGSDQIFAQDNECPSHLVKLEQFSIDRDLVTVTQYQEFIANGGYFKPEWWTEAGWQWLQSKKINCPLYWQPQDLQSPVYGVSWYEADAYARAVGKRLPTEAEWERTAMELNMLGNLWQWTSSQFIPYPGFEGFPYPGYSAVYYDQQHYVLRGGSWATGSLGLRPSFRNWYQPHIRQILAGFRCAV